MQDMLTLIAAGIAGALLGLVFFWGLWLTVRRLPDARHPALRMLVSLLLRFAVVLAGFYVLARQGEWQHLIIAAAGFVLVRLAYVWRISARMKKQELKS